MERWLSKIWLTLVGFIQNHADVISFEEFQEKS